MPVLPARRLAPLLTLTGLVVAGIAPARDHRPPGPPPGRLFISPMGEPFRSDRDGDPEAAWFAGADTDHDGRISLAEFQADARRWFAVIDRGHDGEIDPDDIAYYEDELVPEIRVADAPRSSSRSGGDDTGSRNPRGGGMGRGGIGGSGMGGGGMGGHRGSGQRGAGDGDQQPDRASVARTGREGAARYSYLDLPEPLTAADADMNRGVDMAEMMQAASQRFALLDRNGDGYLEKRELPRVDTRTSGAPPPRAARPHPAAHDDRQLGGGDREEE